MTNWHHNLHLELFPMAASDISSDMLSVEVITMLAQVTL